MTTFEWIFWVGIPVVAFLVVLLLHHAWQGEVDVYSDDLGDD